MVLVTGGANGIGAATVSAFCDQDARVFFCDLDGTSGKAHAKGAGAIFTRVNLASITWHLAPATMSAYVGTKGGILGFTRALARELGPRRIRVNAVSPGWIMTERQLRQYVTPAVKRLIRTSQSIPDLIQPGEIADVVLFLASDASAAITGQEILADRGWAHS